MKLPHRRQFLYLAVSTAALPVLRHIALAQGGLEVPPTLLVRAHKVIG